MITPHKATDTATGKLAVAAPNTETEAGKGELNNAASWDDFPNGRFGDYKSPAFGDPNLWGTSNVSVRILWESPQKPSVHINGSTET